MYYATFDGKDWDKPLNNSVRITGVLADSWTGHCKYNLEALAIKVVFSIIA